ncbi:thioesterase II family protein [Actinoallomurus soli]|uniref:thioesterase II family protein n=1 Tax=Actinoallomurus soli TaxID=2952535 RepID=UPI002093B2D9|nr:alpha/beta fold hydrolase [Actinoallomurus soli]MCO5974050.1 alpha/beta fold hydrolase [Actinoallomurus soli]
MTEPDGRWIRRFRPVQDARATLVCFPFAGGSASYFFPLSRALPAWVEVCAVQYPGRQDRRSECCIEDIVVLADRIAEALRGWPRRDMVLLGHSMGATVAFEVARRLEFSGSVGPSPTRLIASARRAPTIPTETLVHRRTDSEIMSEMRRLQSSSTAAIIDDELLSSFLPAIRADFKAIETYVCAADTEIGCPITAFAGEADPVTSLDQVTAWAECTSGEFDLRVFPGGHFFLDGWSSANVAVIEEYLVV